MSSISRGRLRDIVPVDLRLETLGNAYEAGYPAPRYQIKRMPWVPCEDDPWAQSFF